MTPMLIQLTDDEIAEARRTGRLRQTQNETLGRKQAYGCTESESYRRHEEGMLGEYVVAKAFDLPWKQVGEFRAPDVGKYQVRFTSLPSGRLLLHPADSDSDTFVFVTATEDPKLFAIRGWITGIQGKRNEFWRTLNPKKSPCFVVPTEVLNPLPPNEQP